MFDCTGAHYTTLHYTTLLALTTLHYTTLHYITLYRSVLCWCVRPGPGAGHARTWVVTTPTWNLSSQEYLLLRHLPIFFCGRGLKIKMKIKWTFCAFSKNLSSENFIVLLKNFHNFFGRSANFLIFGRKVRKTLF